MELIAAAVVITALLASAPPLWASSGPSPAETPIKRSRVMPTKPLARPAPMAIAVMRSALSKEHRRMVDCALLGARHRRRLVTQTRTGQWRSCRWPCANGNSAGRRSAAPAFHRLRRAGLPCCSRRSPASPARARHPLPRRPTERQRLTASRSCLENAAGGFLRSPPSKKHGAPGVDTGEGVPVAANLDGSGNRTGKLSLPF